MSEARRRSDEPHRRLNNPQCRVGQPLVRLPLSWIFGAYVAAPEGDEKDDVEAGDRRTA